MRGYFVIESLLKHPNFIVQTLDVVLHQRVAVLLHLVVPRGRRGHDLMGQRRLVEELRSTLLQLVALVCHVRRCHYFEFFLLNLFIIVLGCCLPGRGLVEAHRRGRRRQDRLRRLVVEGMPDLLVQRCRDVVLVQISAVEVWEAWQCEVGVEQV